MIVKRSIPRPDKTKVSPLWLKLLGLFAIAFALAFMAFFAYDMFSSFAERSAVNAQGSDQAPPIVVDPKIESDLAKVLASESAPGPQAVKDPFTDRGGLSGEVSAATTAARQASTTAGSATAGTTTSMGSGRMGSAGGSIAGAPVSAVEATRHRYETWLNQYGVNGDSPLDPRIFSVEDLWPVGIVDGGSGPQEVMFFSEAMNKTVSFPVGTLFFDGWLSEIRPEGVVFSFNDERRTIRLRSWTRSIQGAGQSRPNS
jgi:hypothetical protein